MGAASLVRVELTPAEAKALKRALESYMSELRMEIADTDHMDFKNGLKQERQLLEAVIAKLG